MAQDGPHGHQDTASSDEHSLVVPPTTTTLVLDTTENDGNGGGSRTGSPVDMDANKGNKDVVPNAIEGGEHGSDSRSEGKNPAAAATAAADADAAADDGLTAKGKNSLAADDDDGGELKGQTRVERERRRRMKELYSTLRELMPHVPKKVDKATLVGDAIDFIKSLENTKAQLEKQRQQQVLARQAAAEVGEAASSVPAVPRTAHGMAALSDGWGPAPPQQAPAAAASAAAGPPVEFRTWSTPNVVVSHLTNGEAVINVCAPRQPRIVTMVVSVLKKHGIDVVSMQVGADSVRTIFSIYARVNEGGGENPSAEEMYKLAVSEIMVWLGSPAS